MLSVPVSNPSDETEESGSGMPFLDHLEELRWRLLKSVLSVVVMAGAAFYFRNQLFEFLTAPLGDIQLHFTEVTGSFYAYLKVSLLAGVLAALPIVFYQMWMFLSPGLYRHERSVILPLVFISTLLFLLGAGFCYYLTLPLALDFLIGFSGDLLNPIITVGSYISFAGLLLVAFGAGFELPVVAYFLGKLGLVTPAMLSKGRRYAVVIILIAAAIITPPDVFTQVLLAGPIYLLYEVSIIVVRLTRPRDKS
ncbi:MAG: twin-arginine translocase subunit TatC [bacterium]